MGIVSAKKITPKVKLGIVALQYPPTGGGYSERISGFIKEWCDAGVDIHVITASPYGLGYPQDESSLKDVEGVLSVKKLPTLRGGLSLGLLKSGGAFELVYKIINRLFPIDAHLPWALLSSLAVIRKVNSGDLNILLTSSTPYSVHIVGILVKKIFRKNTPWIADFRDPWTTNYQLKKKNGIFRKKIDRVIEQSIYKYADKIIINTNQNLLDVERSFDIDKRKFTVIQNGFNPTTPISGEATLKTNAEKFRIGYVGGFRGDWFEREFIMSVFRLKKKYPDIYEKIEILLVGTEKIRGKLTENLEIADKFVPCGFHPRSELGNWFSTMDALVLILPDNNGEPLGWVPQRLYLYMATYLPILGIVPSGEAAQYIERSGRGVVIDPTNGLAIDEKLREWVASDVSNNYLGDRAFVNEFSKTFLSRKFLEIFDDCLSETD